MKSVSSSHNLKKNLKGWECDRNKFYILDKIADFTYTKFIYANITKKDGNSKFRIRKVRLTLENLARGKTIWWSREISLDENLCITGLAHNPITKHMSCFLLTIFDNMKCRISWLARRNEKSKWKERGAMWLGEEFITIL